MDAGDKQLEVIFKETVISSFPPSLLLQHIQDHNDESHILKIGAGN